jgi:hypothetical protein
MPDLPEPVDDPRQQLRAQWHRHADAVFDRLFPDDPDAPLPDFDQLEGRAEQLADDLAGWLLQQRLDSHPLVRPATTPDCPRCGQPAQLLDPGDDPLPVRPLTTAVGDVELRRQKCRCRRCRIFFSPSMRRCT